jgi:Trypsin-co-occurring domain 1
LCQEGARLADFYKDRASGTSPIDPYMEKNTPIIVEFSATAGESITRETGIFDRLKRPELVDKSDKAISKSMEVIQGMSQRVNSAITNMNNRPQRVEIEFGIKFDGEVGIVIAKASMEASLNVRLAWDLKS